MAEDGRNSAEKAKVTMLKKGARSIPQTSSNRKIPMPSWRKHESIGHLFGSNMKRSKRKKKVTNHTYDALRYGCFRKPSRAHNPYVRVAFLPQNENFKTLPIYGGGTDVELTEFDENIMVLTVDNPTDWKKSYLHVELWSDTIFDRRNKLLGASTIEFDTLPIFDDKVLNDQVSEPKLFYSHHLVMRESKHSRNKQNENSEDNHSDSYQSAKGYVDIEAQVVSSREIRLRVIKMTGMPVVEPLSTGDVVNSATFAWGTLLVLFYIFFYATIIFVLEKSIHPLADNHIADYDTAIWFAFITLTTLGYGDEYPTNSVSKIVNVIFILVNVLFLAVIVNNSINYMVDHGEEIVETRLNDIMSGFRKNLRKITPRAIDLEEEDNPPGNKRRNSIDILLNRFSRNTLSQKLKMLGKSKSTRRFSKNNNGYDPLKSNDALNNNDDNVFASGESIEMLNSGHHGLSPPFSQLKQGVESIAEQDEEEKGDVDVESKQNSRDIVRRRNSLIDIKVRNTADTMMEKIQIEQLRQMKSDEMENFRKRIIIDGILMIIVALLGIFILAMHKMLIDSNGDYIEDPWIDGLHYVVVSMSTVGYGDIFPVSHVGARFVAATFLLFGTVCLLRGLQVYVEYVQWSLTMKKNVRSVRKIFKSANWFYQFDLNKDCRVTKFEFLRAMLIRLKYVEPSHINRIMHQFRVVDWDKNDAITKKDLRLYLREQNNIQKFGAKHYQEIKKEWIKLRNENKRLKQKEQNLQDREKQLSEREKQLIILEKQHGIFNQEFTDELTVKQPKAKGISRFFSSSPNEMDMKSKEEQENNDIIEEKNDVDNVDDDIIEDEDYGGFGIIGDPTSGASRSVDPSMSNSASRSGSHDSNHVSGVILPAQSLKLDVDLQRDEA